MKEVGLGVFYRGLLKKKEYYPWIGQLELTYRCNLNCIHCYCKGTESKELTTEQWRKIIDEIKQEGCLWLTFTGGEPLIRGDFLEIYAHARAKGFITTIFTNGQLFTKKIMDYLQKYPPESIEITLNGISESVYESISQVKGSFEKAVSVIKQIADKKLPLILKSNCLKQNKDEIGRIKQWADRLLGKGHKRWKFKYDPMIYPRLNQDKTHCKYRLSFNELLEVKKRDPDIWREYQKGLHLGFPDLARDDGFSYRCNSWMNQFFISPYGRLKFCVFSDKFSTDLKTGSFKEGFYRIFPQILNERFGGVSKCKGCSLRPICYNCPARAYLETGDEEAPVEYYCQLAKAMEEEIKKTKNCKTPLKPA